METNESILSKGVVSLDDRKQMGSVRDTIIDCDAMGVSHYLVTSSSTGNVLVLPFEKSISVGDTFMTIQDRADFLANNDPAASAVLEGNFDLVGTKVYSVAGNFIGEVAAYDFDTSTGAVTRVSLVDGGEFTSDQYVFFSQDFVFVDDGTLTDAAKRAGAAAGETEATVPLASPAGASKATEPEPAKPAWSKPAAKAAPEPKPEPKPAPAPAPKVESAQEEPAKEEPAAPSKPAPAKEKPAPAPAKAAPKPEPEPEPSASAEEEDPDAVLKAFLLGKKLTERVVSADGDFVLEAGDTISEEALEKAQAADALLLLTMSVEE